MASKIKIADDENWDEFEQDDKKPAAKTALVAAQDDFEDEDDKVSAAVDAREPSAVRARRATVESARARAWRTRSN